MKRLTVFDHRCLQSLSHVRWYRLKSHDSILSKLDTFKRKKKARLEVEELTKESRQAIEMAVSALSTDDPKQYQLEEGQERSFIEKSSQNSESVKNLLEKLLTWINNELSEQRILVRDIQEDLYDGQLLQKLVEKLAKIKLDHPELTQSEIGQLQRLRGVLQTVNEILHVSESWASQRWTAERIHQKDLVAILRLLVAIARQFEPQMRFQPGIFLTVIIARKLNGKLEYRYEREYITEFTEKLPAGNPLDAISEHHMVLQAVVAFINAYLEQVGFHVTDLSKDFRDGVLLILLMGLIEGYFVPFYAYHPTPTTEEMCLSNVKLGFELIQAAGMIEPPAKPEDIVAGDTSAILRVLYGIYSYCAHMEEDEQQLQQLQQHEHQHQQHRHEITNIHEQDEIDESQRNTNMMMMVNTDNAGNASPVVQTRGATNFL
uniref:Calponin-homology (CH) domain-containing protein n=1 Tax=Trichobilharzia regenti TaxID=157069 RepID=A0AA85K2A8_TRIRE|nr:unnamed protein product [Trichobilharzia regenti]